MRTIRLLAVIALGALGTAGSCDDNLGDNEARPITFRASLGNGNVSANGASRFSRSSADGRFVVFQSTATNIAPPPSSFTEIFVRDRLTDTVQNISRIGASFFPNSAADCVNPSISPNGQYVVFECKGDLVSSVGVQTTSNIFRFDRNTNSLDAVIESPALPWPNFDCTDATVADDGNVAFITAATNIGFATGSASQVFYRDMAATPGITLVSHTFGTVTTAGGGAAIEARITGDGQSVAFIDNAGDLVSPATTGFQTFISGITPGAAIEVVSRATGAGAVGNSNSLALAVSPDGRFVSFFSRATNLVPGVAVPGICIRDRGVVPPTTEAVAQDMFFLAGGSIQLSDRIAMSDDGRFVIYLAAGTFNVHVRDRLGGTRIVNINEAGIVLRNPALFAQPDISGDGRWAFFISDSPDLVLDDDNGTTDVFGHGPLQ